MKIRFIFHSSFLIECDRCYLLFDYYLGDLPSLDPEKPLYVMASHQHYDHFSPGIFQLVRKYPKCVFLLSDDISMDLVGAATEELGEMPQVLMLHEGDTVYLRPTEGSVEILEPGRPEPLVAIGGGETGSESGEDRVVVRTFSSTDLGVSFLVQADGKRIFHAGDLNDWCWPNEWQSRNEEVHANYIRILDDILDYLKGEELDVVFHPMDPVLGVSGFQGPVEFLKRIPTRRFYPMHMWERYSIGQKFLEAFPEYKDVFCPISGPGDVTGE